MNDRMKRNIVLIGSMGSGKSHLGRNLAEDRGWQFVDTDRILEKRFQLPIADIYKKIGPRAFRHAELDILRQVCMYHEAVISVGGNFPLEMHMLRHLEQYSYIIGIRASHYRIVNRIKRWIGKRPTMDYTDVGGFVARMMRRWKSVYKQCHCVVDTTYGDTEALLDEVEEAIVNDRVEFKKRMKRGNRHEKYRHLNKRR